MLALSASAAAFAPAMRPVQAPRAEVRMAQSLEELAKEQNPAIGFFDPLNLSKMQFTEIGESLEASNAWLRHAEIKHGRVAMAGFIGYILHENGVHWPWPLANGLDYSTFDGLSAPAVWDALPAEAKYQIITFVGFLELWSESSYVLKEEGESHYMRGGKPGFYPPFTVFSKMVHPVPLNLYDPFKLGKKMTDEQKAKRLNMEVNNGRLAMIGLFGFISAAEVPGSVPLLDGIIKPYAGDVMAPFQVTL